MLQVEHLTRRYGKVTAVDDLSIDQVRSIYVGETTSWDAL